MARKFVHRDTLDVLHDKVRLIVDGVPGVEQASDAGMIERGEDLAFPQETIAASGIIGRATDELDGNAMIYLAIAALRQKDGTHAALAEKANQFIGATRVAGGERGIGTKNFRGNLANAIGQGRVMRVEAAERFDLGTDFRRNLPVIEVSFPLVRWEIGNLGKQGPYVKAHGIPRTTQPVIIAFKVQEKRGEITELLERARAGDASASEELMSRVHAQLHRIARRHLHRERPDHTLQPTALVNEAYLRMFGNSQPEFADRSHFIAVASRVMRRILVDYARARRAERRGGDALRVGLDTAIEMEMDGSQQRVELTDLDRAIEALSSEHPPLGEVIEMRYFGGLTAEEIAQAVGRTVHVVRHEIRFAQAWLRRELL
jgi:RNA polymerase sigma factor (TIGR02999 family)